MGSDRQVLSAASVIGQHVRTRQGEKVGKVDDVILDPETGRIVGAVLAYDDAFRPAHRMSPIPWDALTLSEDDGLLYVDAAAVEHPLRRRQDWPETGVPQWSRSVVVYTASISGRSKGVPGA